MSSSHPDRRQSKNVGAAVLRAVDSEVIEEQAASLSRAARRLEKALEALRNFDAGIPPPKRRGEPLPDRPALLSEAREALWFLIVQREACGFRNSEELFVAYAIPKELSFGMRMPTLATRWRPR
jgi:hypothetical protein